ncbi:MmpS family transport accessory protein [Rhizomonospora bruguierae]|uniref:MmpS family transport accessory protein n=1 Tax=Rhizomonospora bruguierae TaxID=1581705 RepID=UPI001BCD718C|nr:MmpS family transport accessory protein [Micromonospora sp. NBRC 107566]
MSYPPPPPFDPNQPNQNDPNAPYQPPAPYQPSSPYQPPAQPGQGQEPPTMPYGQPPQSVPPAPPPYDPQAAPPPPYDPQAAPPPPGYQPGQGAPSYAPPPGYPPTPEYGAQPGYPPVPGAPGVQPPKKSKAPMIISIVVGVVLVLCLGCVGAGYLWFKQAKDTLESLPTAPPTFDLPTGGPGTESGGGSGTGSGKTVRYEVTGSGEATVTYAGSDGHIKQEKVTLPWSKEVTAANDFFFASLVVLQLGENKTLGCKVSADGKEIRSKESQGVVSCSGIVE